MRPTAITTYAYGMKLRVCIEINEISLGFIMPKEAKTDLLQSFCYTFCNLAFHRTVF